MLLRQKNLDGKSHFIGCARWKSGDPAFSHRFLTIPVSIQESHVRELFQEGGVLKTLPDTLKDVNVGKCAHVLMPRSGGKGKRLCRA
jgi:hypothetical protein